MNNGGILTTRSETVSRTAKIRKVVWAGNGSSGPDTCFVVDLYEGSRLMESRELIGKSVYYAEDVAENWETGIIQLGETNEET